MSIYLAHRPDYVVNEIITQSKNFPKIYNSPWNSASFQIQWSALESGEFVVYGSNENPPKFQLTNFQEFVPTLTPIPLASIDVTQAPYSSINAAMIEVTSACAVIWLGFVGGPDLAPAVVSVAFHAKSLG